RSRDRDHVSSAGGAQRIPRGVRRDRQRDVGARPPARTAHLGGARRLRAPPGGRAADDRGAPGDGVRAQRLSAAGIKERPNYWRSLVKLYIKPGACSLSPHIVSRELGLPIDVIKADTKSPDFQK